MFISTTETAEAPTVGTFRYISRGITPNPNDQFYHLPPIAEFGDVRKFPLHDMRPELESRNSPYKLNTHGFTALRCPSALHSAPYSRASWDDHDILKSVYIPEIEDMLKKVTGATKIFTEGALLRSSPYSDVDGLIKNRMYETNDTDPDARKTEEPGEAPPVELPQIIGTGATAGVGPAPKVHLDYAPEGARIHLRDFHPAVTAFSKDIIAAEDRIQAKGLPLKQNYDGPRWALFSIWRPLKPVVRDPLALLDCQTIPDEDHVSIKVRFPGARGPHDVTSYVARGSDKHAWHWISNQQPEELLVIQFFDSDYEKSGLGIAGGVLHSSVDLEGMEKEEPRESLEVRCLAVW